MEVPKFPRLGVESELPLLAYTTATAMRELSLICNLQTMSMPDPEPTEQGQGLNSHLQRYWLGVLPLSHNRNSQIIVHIKKKKTRKEQKFEPAYTFI